MAGRRVIGGTLGYRVGHVYFPRSGIIIAFAVNSATDQDNEALGAQRRHS
ncbi:MAG TPA: hypothetical protein VHN16_16775 [Streptosporangiaceae bacterium]|nr:hypothetical protein [Streptosporangiaceae bacterium]